MGGATWEPQEIISTLQASAILENRDPRPLLATDLRLGFVAVGGCNLLGVRFITLGVQEDVIYLPKGTTFAPKKMFSLPSLPFRFKKLL